jgi:hypothetical protein
MPVRAVVLGYAETATALGHAVADGLGDAVYLHSTRRPVEGVGEYGGFEEEHSHATSHLLLPVPADLLEGEGPVVLVDDEMSTGRPPGTRCGHSMPYGLVIIMWSPRWWISGMPRSGRRWTRWRPSSEPGSTSWPWLQAGSFCRRGSSGRSGPVASLEAGDLDAGPAEVRRVDLGWPDGLPDGGRHGFTPDDRAALEKELPELALTIMREVPAGARRVLVLGFEELMYAPLRLAEALADLGEFEVRYSTTTRSPVLAVDDPGYAIRTRLAFPSHDDAADGAGERYAYNVVPGESEEAFDAVVLVVDDVADTPELHAGLLTKVGTTVLLIVIPSYRPTHTSIDQGGLLIPEPLYGPEFGSYARQDVAWLLTDLSEVTLEAPTEEREEAIQSGAAHYAESLPVEYQPSAAYQELFHQALAEAAPRLAHAVAVIGERILAERGPDAVLVSLARAGTPVGILVKRWAKFATISTWPTTPSASCVAGASTPSRWTTWRSIMTRPRSSSWTAGRARARSPASSRRRSRAQGSHRRGRPGRPGALRADLRHPRRLPDPVGMPQLRRSPAWSAVRS